MRKTNELPELDKLFDEVGTYRSSADFRELLDFIKRFRRIAPYNAMLLHIQKPGSTYVASASDWRDRFHRRPKPGARPLIILRPFGPVAFVYELTDTEGEPFPQKIESPFFADGIVPDSFLDKFSFNMFLNGISLTEQDYGTDSAGFIKVVNEQIERVDHNVIRNYLQPFSMVINRNMNNAGKLATIFHELGHLYCGHLRNNRVKYLPKRYGLSLNQREFEAESVCWLLCERQGISNPSASYLSGYLDHNDTIPNISIDTVVKAVGAIENIMKSESKTYKKELIIK